MKKGSTSNKQRGHGYYIVKKLQTNNDKMMIYECALFIEGLQNLEFCRLVHIW
jgi:hypothetical protein